MKRVALLKSRLSRIGGIEKYSLRTAHAFAESGCAVTVLTTEYTKDISTLPFKVVNLPVASRANLMTVWQYDQQCQDWLRENPVDIIFGMDRNRRQTHCRAGNGVHAAYLQRRQKTDSFWKRMFLPINPLHRAILQMEREAFEHPELQLLVANSHMVQKEILEHYRVEPSKIQVIHNGVEWNEMAADFLQWEEQKQHLLQHLGLDPVYQFLFIGNGYRRKGLRYLLEGLSALPTRDFQLSVLGKDKELGYFTLLAKRLGLEKQVKFFGQRPDVRDFYKVADCLTIPSTYDPFANVTVEALAMGLFVLSSRFNGGSEVLTPSTGLVIDELFSRDSLQEALESALRHPKTASSASYIRGSVQSLDFSNQLQKMIQLTLM